MSKPIIRIHDMATGEVIDREMTTTEFKIYEASQLADSAKQAESETKATAKAALLNKLGITEQEARLLLS